MANQNGEPVEDKAGDVAADPWEAAFAALSDQSKEAAAPDPGDTGGDGSSAGGDDGQQVVPDNDEAGDGSGNQAPVGELGDADGADGSQVASAEGGVPEFSQEELDSYRQQVEQRVRDQAIDDVAAEFARRGIRNRNGMLGASIDDPDICKRDSDGMPTFYNPDTGREFTGDNPRRQAQEWVDDYNAELARVFNETCKNYEAKLMEKEAPRLAVLEFAPTYEKLDPIRKGMFDNVVQDYEVEDANGNVIGYTCDLDKALALVDRQISMIQGYAKEHASQQKPEPTGPVLDMKTSSGAIPSGDAPAPTSLAEAMERQQDALLAKLKK